jgi:hypothetical protein
MIALETLADVFTPGEVTTQVANSLYLFNCFPFFRLAHPVRRNERLMVPYLESRSEDLGDATREGVGRGDLSSLRSLGMTC